MERAPSVKELPDDASGLRHLYYFEHEEGSGRIQMFGLMCVTSILYSTDLTREVAVLYCYMFGIASRQKSCVVFNG